jgi:hypothetical protein
MRSASSASRSRIRLSGQPDNRPAARTASRVDTSHLPAAVLRRRRRAGGAGKQLLGALPLGRLNDAHRAVSFSSASIPGGLMKANSHPAGIRTPIPWSITTVASRPAGSSARGHM